MKIIIDCALDGQGFPAGFMFVDVSDPIALATLAAIQADKSKLAASGWGELSSLPGLADGVRRWDVIVAAQSKKAAPVALTALALTA